MPEEHGRPTFYEGVRMRSRLEAGFAAWCDQVGFSWQYEPAAFASQVGQYLPDFALKDVHCAWRDEAVTVYVEVKPESVWAVPPDHPNHPENVGQRMSIIYDSEGPDVELVIAIPKKAPIFDRLLSVQPAGNLSDPLREIRATLLPAEWVISPPAKPGVPRPPILAVLQKGPWSGKYWTVE